MTVQVENMKEKITILSTNIPLPKTKQNKPSLCQIPPHTKLKYKWQSGENICNICNRQTAHGLLLIHKEKMDTAIEKFTKNITNK